MARLPGLILSPPAPKGAGYPIQFKKSFNFLEREGWRSFRRALASI